MASYFMPVLVATMPVAPVDQDGQSLAGERDIDGYVPVSGVVSRS